MTTQIIQGTITSTGAAASVVLPTGCDYFRMVNYTNQGSTANPGVVKSAEWFRGMPAASAIVTKNTNSAATNESSKITTNGFTFNDSTLTLTLGTGVVGAASDVIYYVAYKANRAAGDA